MFHEVLQCVLFLSSAFLHNVVLRCEIMHSCGGSTSGPFFSVAQCCACWGLFTQSRVDGRLGYCQLGAATNNVFRSIVPKSSYGHMLSFIRGTPSKGMNRLYCRCTFKFLGNRRAAFQGTCVIRVPTSHVWVPDPPHPNQCLAYGQLLCFYHPYKCGFPLSFFNLHFLTD